MLASILMCVLSRAGLSHVQLHEDTQRVQIAAVQISGLGILDLYSGGGKKYWLLNLSPR